MDGRRSAFESTVRQMVAETKQEPGTLAYEFYITEDGAECRLLEGYVDSDAAASHVTGPGVAVWFRCFSASSMDIAANANDGWDGNAIPHGAVFSNDWGQAPPATTLA